MRSILGLGLLIISLNLIGQDITFLNGNWQFKRQGDEKWLPASVPGTVHQDLMRNGIIEDVYFENNAQAYQWIENDNWLYQTQFEIKESTPAQTLVFEGLDTYAKVYLDGSLALEANNMFRTWELDLMALKPGTHSLRVEFISPYRQLEEKVKAYPVALPAGSEEGELKASPFCRKAAYHFGWDWAPRIVTAGIYRKVYLRSQKPYIRKVSTEVLAIRDSTVFVQWNYDIVGAGEGYQIELQSQRFDLEVIPNARSQYAPIVKAIRKARLWWPHSHGEPYLYRDTLRLFKES